ncbi:MAG TPA: restriction endonuclease subunit S [Opitutaceae bacterium]|nr:restriction endonuclease subunit S [Opitutaceae bacterium]HPK48784.1 restriction endonuclease subunit S [Opitutaceae bacterium]
MEVKPGYKQTELGVIPEGWDIRKLPDLSWFQEGPGLRNWQFTASGMKVINVTNLENGVLNLDRTDRHISLAEFNRTYRHFAVEDADIVMASSGNSYSKTAIVRPQDLPLVMNTSVIRFRPAKGCDYGFLWALLNSPQFKQQIDLMITGGAQPNFGPYHLNRICVPFPPLPEQRAIAEALSDVDGLLGGLDRLIAKKRDLKQAAMQQLLTGQTRLAGFHCEWEVKRLGELADIRSGGTPSTTEPRFWDGDIPWCTPTDITALNGHKYLGETSRMITQQGLKASSAEMIPAQSIVMTSRATIGECAINTVPVSTNQGFKNFVPFSTTDVDFLYYLLSTQKQGFVSLCGGSTFLEIGKTQLVAYVVRLPATKAEQTAIAEVLTAMDAELTALEQRREKTRALKQAMMQELLTGRTRLV